MYRNARRFTGGASVPGGARTGWWREEEQPRHVACEGYGSQQLERRGVVEIDRVARLIDVDRLAVARDAQRHTRPAAERRAVDHAVRLEIERPELVLADVTEQAIGALVVAR